MVWLIISCVVRKCNYLGVGSSYLTRDLSYCNISVPDTFHRDQKPGFWVDETPFRALGDPRSKELLAQTGKNLVSLSKVSGGKCNIKLNPNLYGSKLLNDNLTDKLSALTNRYCAEMLAFCQRLVQTPSLSGEEGDVAALIRIEMERQSLIGEWRMKSEE